MKYVCATSLCSDYCQIEECWKHSLSSRTDAAQAVDHLNDSPYKCFDLKKNANFRKWTAGKNGKEIDTIGSIRGTLVYRLSGKQTSETEQIFPEQTILDPWKCPFSLTIPLSTLTINQCVLPGDHFCPGLSIRKDQVSFLYPFSLSLMTTLLFLTSLHNQACFWICTLQPWSWRQHVPPKHGYPPHKITRCHDPHVHNLTI
jgi:hypothetical protein